MEIHGLTLLSPSYTLSIGFPLLSRSTRTLTTASLPGSLGPQGQLRNLELLGYSGKLPRGPAAPPRGVSPRGTGAALRHHQQLLIRADAAGAGPVVACGVCSTVLDLHTSPERRLHVPVLQREAGFDQSRLLMKGSESACRRLAVWPGEHMGKKTMQGKLGLRSSWRTSCGGWS